MSENNQPGPLSAAVSAGERFQDSMGKLLAEATASPEAVQPMRDIAQQFGGDGEELTDQQVRDLQERITAGLEAHKTHRQAWRLDPDGIYRCPECDPVPAATAVCREDGMSNYAKESHLNGRAIVGPEVVNGTGEVYLDIPAPIHMSAEEARELAAAIIGAAEYAEQRKQEVDG